MKLGICLSVIVMMAVAGCKQGCSGGSQVQPQTVVTDVEIGLNAAKCILDNVPADEAKGMTEAQAIEAAVVTCGLQAVANAPAKVQALLESHRKAEVVEGKVGAVDGGAAKAR